ncbi:MAG: hypothetical protein ACRDPK_04765 [Carbonactinosporaceae bacterium]
MTGALSSLAPARFWSGELGIASIGGRVLAIWRAQLARLTLLGVLVILPFYAVEAVTVALSPVPEERGLVPNLVLALSGVAWGVVGEALYAGIVEHLARSHQLGAPQPAMSAVLRALPLGRLVLVSMVLGALVVVGFSLLVVPGLVALTLLVVATPLVSIERRSVRSALAGSIRLVRRRFWDVLLVTAAMLALVTVPEDVAVLLEDADAPLWIETALEGVLEVMIAPVVGLTMVVLLRTLQRTVPEGAAAGSAADGGEGQPR